MTQEEKDELVKLLSAITQSVDEGILETAKRAMTGDKQVARIARIEELLKKL